MEGQCGAVTTRESRRVSRESHDACLALARLLLCCCGVALLHLLHLLHRLHLLHLPNPISTITTHNALSL